MRSQQEAIKPIIFALQPGLHDLHLEGAADEELEQKLDWADDRTVEGVRLLGAEVTLPIDGLNQSWTIHVDGHYLAVEALARRLQAALDRQVRIEDLALQEKIKQAFGKSNEA